VPPPAEAGIAPGVFLFISYWFPTAYRARYNAVFIYAVPVAYAVASVVSGWIMQLDGTLGLPGWKWLFLLEGLPAILLGLFGLWSLVFDQQAHGSPLAERGRRITTLVGHIQEKTHSLTPCFALVIAVLLVVAVIAYILGQRLKRMPDASLHAAVGSAVAGSPH
jgi:MFS family permease